jgi:hypothetical protein
MKSINGFDEEGFRRLGRSAEPNCAGDKYCACIGGQDEKPFDPSPVLNLDIQAHSSQNEIHPCAFGKVRFYQNEMTADCIP